MQTFGSAKLSPQAQSTACSGLTGQLSDIHARQVDSSAERRRSPTLRGSPIAQLPFVVLTDTAGQQRVFVAGPWIASSNLEIS